MLHTIIVNFKPLFTVIVFLLSCKLDDSSEIGFFFSLDNNCLFERPIFGIHFSCKLAEFLSYEGASANSIKSARAVHSVYIISGECIVEICNYLQTLMTIFMFRKNTFIYKWINSYLIKGFFSSSSFIIILNLLKVK